MGFPERVRSRQDGKAWGRHGMGGGGVFKAMGDAAYDVAAAGLGKNFDNTLMRSIEGN